MESLATLNEKRLTVRTNVCIVSTTRGSFRTRLHDFRHSPDFTKLWRYGTISVVSTAVSLTGLFFFYRILSFSPGWSNIWATVIATIPYYYLNRMWVFNKRGRSHLTKEVIPFWPRVWFAYPLYARGALRRPRSPINRLQDNASWHPAVGKLRDLRTALDCEVLRVQQDSLSPSRARPSSQTSHSPTRSSSGSLLGPTGERVHHVPRTPFPRRAR